MSEGKRKWRFYINDMILFSDKVLVYTEGMDRDGFTADEKTHDAVLRNLELIGEAAANVPAGVRKAHPEIPWRQIIATRNCLIHAYLGLDEMSCGASWRKTSLRSRRCSSSCRPVNCRKNSLAKQKEYSGFPD